MLGNFKHCQVMISVASPHVFVFLPCPTSNVCYFFGYLQLGNKIHGVIRRCWTKSHFCGHCSLWHFGGLNNTNTNFIKLPFSSLERCSHPVHSGPVAMDTGRDWLLNNITSQTYFAAVRVLRQTSCRISFKEELLRPRQNSLTWRAGCQKNGSCTSRKLFTDN